MTPSINQALMISAIVLAAGLSSRMGEQNKLLLDLGGQPLIRHVVSRIVAASPGEIIVVLGHESESVKNALTGLDLLFVQNDSYVAGMTSSIQAGVNLARGEGYMICLSDMYAMEAADYQDLIEFFKKQYAKDDHCICLPVFKGSRGNPVIFSAAYRQNILEHQEPEGCRSIVSENQSHLVKFEMMNGHALQDLDFPEDYHRLQKN